MAAIDHGSASTYTNHGCRCDECRTAKSAVVARQRSERRALLALGLAAVVEHGRASTYQNYCCRCDPCTDANAARLREYRAARAER